MHQVGGKCIESTHTLKLHTVARIGHQAAFSNVPAQAEVGNLCHQVVPVLQQHIWWLEVHVHNLPCRTQVSGHH